jgi:O-antigen/teichoic acid export membrane protein
MSMANGSAELQDVPGTLAPHPPAADAGAGVEDQQHRARRGRRLRLAVVTSLLTRPLAFVISLLTVPLFIRYLGAERFGLYDSIVALTLWLSLTNAGLGIGLMNRLQDCYVSGDTVLARRYVSSLWIAVTAMSLAGLLVITAVVPLVEWDAVFRTTTPEAGRGTALAVWVAAAIVLVSVTVSVPSFAYAAYQEMHVMNLWEGLARVATLAACFAVVFVPLGGSRFGLSAVILASAGVAVLVRMAAVAWQLKRTAWLRPSLKLFDAGLLRITLSEGLWLFLLQIATMLVFQVDKLIISNRLGAAEVTPYSVVGRVFLMAYGVFGVIMYPMWPAYGEAIRRGDVAWARRGIRMMLALGTAAMLGCGAALYFFGGPIVGLLTRGQDVDVSRGLVLAMTAMFVMRAWAECQSIPLNAAGVVRPQIAILLGNGVLNVILALLLVKPYGVLGVAWSFPLSAIVTTVWGYPWLIRKHLSKGAARAGGAPPAGVVDGVAS